MATCHSNPTLHHRYIVGCSHHRFVSVVWGLYIGLQAALLQLLISSLHVKKTPSSTGHPNQSPLVSEFGYSFHFTEVSQKLSFSPKKHEVLNPPLAHWIRYFSMPSFRLWSYFLSLQLLEHLAKDSRSSSPTTSGGYRHVLPKSTIRMTANKKHWDTYKKEWHNSKVQILIINDSYRTDILQHIRDVKKQSLLCTTCDFSAAETERMFVSGRCLLLSWSA